MKRDSIPTLPGRLRELRAAAGLTQADLARLAGLRVTEVSRFEVGARTPSLRTAAALAHALGRTVDDLLRAD